MSHVEKVERVPGAGAGHGHGGGPRAVVARGAPAGVPPPSGENRIKHLLKPKPFWRLPYHLSWPPLAATLGQLVNPVWDWWRWRPCQESRLLERVRCLDVQLSNTAPLCRSVLLHSCCPLLRHPYYVAANRKLPFLVFTVNLRELEDFVVLGRSLDPLRTEIIFQIQQVALCCKIFV